MPILPNYSEFEGRHWETGTVRNALAYQGMKAPHTNSAPTEALLMGISGGAVFGYFTFDYEGYDPILALLTRNTFDPLETLFERLGIPQNYIHTNKPEKAIENLYDVLESGQVPIVWADMMSLPYNGYTFDESMWAMFPVVVYRHDGDTAAIADRAKKPLTISADDLQSARARVKKDKFRILTLESPNWDKLPSAVQKGIWQTISLYTEKPPKGAKNNFGFVAMQHWAKMLTNTRNKQSWERYFPAGNRLYAALTSVYGWIHTWGAGNGFERQLYADFLDEAAIILGKSDLKAVGAKFRESSRVWCELSEAVLPENVPLLKEARDLLARKHTLFIEEGDAGVEEVLAIGKRLDELKAAAKDNFPMSQDETVAMREGLAELVLKIHDIEFEAIELLQAVMG
jgi:hypothetical protein